MYTCKIGISKEEHDNFVKSSNLVNLLQSSSWAQIKDNWENERIGFYDNDELVATASLLIRKLPLGFTMIYVPRGPIMNYTDKNLVKFVIDSLKKYGKTKRALFVKIDPMISYYSFKLGEEKELNPEAELTIKNIEDAGATWSGLTTNMAETIQPRFNAVIRKEDFSEDNFSKKTKQFLRKSRNSAPIIKFGSDELVDDFAYLMKKTEERKEVSLRNKDYYLKMLHTYPDEAFLTMVYYNFKVLLSDATEKFSKAKDEYENPQTNNGKKLKRIEENYEVAQKNLDSINKVIEEHGEIVPVAGGLIINFGGNAEHLYAGMDTEFQKYYPAYLAWYESINHAFETGARTLNMGGLENSLSESDGLLNFKKNFIPTVEESIGEFDIPVNKFLFSASNLAYKIRKKISG